MKKVLNTACAKSRRNIRVASAAAGVASAFGVLGPAGSVRADYFWIGGNGDFTNTNWGHVDFTQNPNVYTGPVGPPVNGTGGDQNAIIGGGYNNGSVNLIGGDGTVSMTDADGNWTPWDLRVSDASGTTDVFNQSGSTLSVNGWLRVGTTGGGSGTFNLTGDGVVNANLDFNVAESGTGTFNQSAGTTVNVAGTFFMGRNSGGNGTVNMTGGTFNVNNNNWYEIGSAPNSTGVVNMSGGTINCSSDLDVGLSGTGTMNVSGGSSVTVNGWLFVGKNAGASGTLNITGGTVHNNGRIFLGANNGGPGTGTLNVSGTGTYFGGDLIDMGDNGATGYLNLSGNGSITTNSDLWVGNGGGSTGVAIQTGGTMTVNGNLNDGFNGTGTYNLTAGTINANGQIWVGEGGGGNGTLNITGGTINLNNWLAVGRDGGTALINMSGGTFTKLPGSGGDVTFVGSNNVFNQSGGNFNNSTSQTWLSEGGTSFWNQTGGTDELGGVIVGKFGPATWNVSGAGTTVTAANVTVGYNIPGNTGTWNINNSAQATANTVYMSQFEGSSVLNVASGGLLNASRFVRGGSNSGNANLYLNPGGTIQANGNAIATNSGTTSFISGFRAGEVNFNGGTLDTQGYTIQVDSPISGTGGFTKAGTGTLVFSGTGSTYSGTTKITNGVVQLAAPTTSQVIPPSTVASYWSFENPADPFADSSGNGNELVVGYNAQGNQGTVVYQPGVAPNGHAGSIALNNSGYLTTQSNAFPNGVPTGASGYTIGLWVNLDGTNTGANGFVGWGNYGSNGQVNAFRTTSATGLLNYWWAADATAGTPNSMVGNWTYVAVTYDPTVGTDGMRSFWVLENGVMVDVGNNDPGQPGGSTASNFAIGATNNLAEYFDGNMADLIIANVAYTPAQLLAASQNNFSSTYTSNAGAISPNTDLQISTGATFDLNGQNASVAGLAGQANSYVTMEAGNLTVNQANPGEFDGIISGAGSLTVGGTAALTLGGPNSYTGGTNVAPGASLVVTGAGSLAAGGNLNVSGSLMFDAGTGTGIFNRSAGIVTVNTGGLVTLQSATVHANRTLLTASNVVINGTGQLDAGNNDLDLTGASLATITSYVSAGYNEVGGANWNGAGGIISTAAAANTKHLTALGVIQNNQGGSPIYGPGNLFDGAAPGASDILVKYTYFGDANLDGKVDGSDYSLIDAGYAADKAHPGSVSGWYHGDFNYDGTIDGSDYALIDNAYNNQTVNLTSAALVAETSAQVATAGPSAVPEPASIGLIALAAAGLAGRRRHRGQA